MSKYNYGGMSFKTKATLTNYIKYILRNTKLYTPLSGKDLSVVDDVLRNHSEYEQKVGVGDY